MLSYTTLGVESVMSLLRGYELVVLGEGVELFSIAVPPSLRGRRLADSGIGSAHRHERGGARSRRYARHEADR